MTDARGAQRRRVVLVVSQPRRRSAPTGAPRAGPTSTPTSRIVGAGLHRPVDRVLPQARAARPAGRRARAARSPGFGASGRNGGWLTNSVTGGRARYADDAGPRGRDRAAASAQRRRSTRSSPSRRARASTPTSSRAASSASRARRRSWRGCGRARRAEQSWPHTDAGGAGCRGDGDPRIRIAGALGGAVASALRAHPPGEARARSRRTRSSGWA